MIVAVNPKILGLLPDQCIKTYNEEPRAVGWSVFSSENNCYFIRFKNLSEHNPDGDVIAKKKRMGGSSKMTILGSGLEYGHLVTNILKAKEEGLHQEVPDNDDNETGEEW